jgi:putative nucleotidyltransferase with HDIG domain
MFDLERFGLGRKKKGYFPDRKVRDSKSDGLINNPFVKATIILLFIGLIIVFIPGSSFRDLSYKLGEPWRDDDLNAPFTFSLLKDREEMRQAVDDVQRNTPPIFYNDLRAIQRVESKSDSIFRSITPVVENYLQFTRSRINNSLTVFEDSLRYMNARNNSGVMLSDAAWRILLDNYAMLNVPRYQPNLPRPSRFAGIDIRLSIDRIILELFADGVIDVPKPELTSSEIFLRDNEDRTQRVIGISNLRDQSEARDYARFRIERTLNEEMGAVAIQLFELIFEPNYYLNSAETDASIQEAIDSISPTKGAVSAGQVIIRKGDLITQERLTMLQSLEEARVSRASNTEIWEQYAGNTIILGSIFLFFLMYLYLYRNPIFDNNSMLLLVLLALGIVIAFAIFIIRSENLSIYMVPIAIAPIILTIIFDSRVGLMTTTTLALAIAFMSGNNFEYVVAATTASSIAVYSVRDVKNRNQFFLTTPALVFLSYVMILLGFTLIKPTGWAGFWNQVLFVGGNAIFIWLTYPLILLFEKLFNVTTEVSLLELNNNNHPLLKQLMVRAPGTFQHSLQVANLAEAACSAIGANSLLARVGALYHDIGKMDKPEYFVENQFGDNEHDKLKPRMSALVIKNHVTTGVKMAHESNLPEVIIDFIRSHHGNSIIKYFYDKARKSAENESEIREEDFRYDGPLPNSKETGILLLADCVEASSRAMSEPSYPKLENLVNRMIEERVQEGQLNNCSLTFQDIRIIKDSFLSIMVGVYHSRIKYPGQDEKDSFGSRKSSVSPANNSPNSIPSESD